MSWHYLAGQEAESWEENSLDGAPSALLKLMPTAVKSCCKDNATESSIDSRYGMTSEHSTDTNGAEKSTSSQVGSPVRIFQRPEKERESGVNVLDCGRTWPVSSVKFNPDTCWWKTHHCLFPEDLTLYWLILPRWGSTRSGELSERTMPAHLTSGTESGYWLTPTATDANPPTGGNLIKTKNGTIRALNKETGKTSNRGLANQAMWCRDRKDGAAKACKNAPVNSLLGRAIHGGTKTRQTYSTPTTHDYKGKNNSKSGTASSHSLATQCNAGRGSLNPDWVEWLMGWPITWSSMIARTNDGTESSRVKGSPEEISTEGVRNLRRIGEATKTSQGSKQEQQHCGKHLDTLPGMPQGRACERWGLGEWSDAIERGDLCCLREVFSSETLSQHQKLYLVWFAAMSDRMGSTECLKTMGQISRTAYKMKNQVDRLKAIGDGQVPAVVALAWRALTAQVKGM